MAGGAGDQKVRHIRQIRHDGVAIHVLAQGQRDFGFGVAPLV